MQHWSRVSGFSKMPLRGNHNLSRPGYHYILVPAPQERTGHRTTHNERGRRSERCTHPNQQPRMYCYNLYFPVRRVCFRYYFVGGMLHPIYRPGAGITDSFPAQSIGWHHESSFLAISTAVAERNFGTTNYSKRTDTHHTRTLLSVPTSEPSPH